MFAGKEDFKIEYTRGLIETYAKPLKDLYETGEIR